MGKRTADKVRMERVRLDSGQHRRIMLVMLALGVVAFVPVGLRLYGLMVKDYDFYAAKALNNQTRTTRVEAERGTIYDRNMNILATSVGVENIYLDPHELKQSGADVEDISRFLGETLERDPQWIGEQAVDLKQRYKQVGVRVDSDTAGVIREYIRDHDVSGIHLEPAN